MEKKSKNLKTDPFVSVIVPVYNDLRNLKFCLDALEKQSYPKNSYEIIVVDNDSDKKIDKLVNQYRNTVLTHQMQPGSYAARNKGISFSKGEIIAFTDSDCIPFPDWIEKGVSKMLTITNCGLLSGKIKLFFKNKDKLTTVEVYEKINAFPQKTRIERYDFGVTANLFTFKTVIENIGLFNQKLKSGGDVEWGRRVKSAGYTQIYSEDTCVLHPARNSFKQIFRKTKRVVGGIWDLNQTEKYLFKDLVKDLKRLIGAIIGLIRRFIIGLPPSEKFRGGKQKIQYLIVYAFIGTVKVYEKIKISKGTSTKRA